MAAIEIYKDAISLATNAARHFISIGQQAIINRGRFSVTLAGGSTPRGLYTLLASETYKHQLDWDKVYVFWGDERLVPAESPESNFNLAKQTLLDHVPIPQQNIFRIQGELEPELASEIYSDVIKEFFQSNSEGSIPQFDMILLGLGEDGHTASLFPHTKALDEKTLLVAHNHVLKLDVWRITFTYRLINSAANILFLVSGESKAKTLRMVIEESHQPDRLPAQGIDPINGKLTWLVDKAAASNLTKN